MEWRSAAKTDRSVIQQFQCTDPPPRNALKRPVPDAHPRKWELAIQSAIHSLKPPGDENEATLLGLGEGGLAAVARVTDQGERDYYLDLVAVAIRHRRGDGLVAWWQMQQ